MDGDSKVLLEVGSGPRGQPGLSPDARSWPRAGPHLCVLPEGHVAPPGRFCPRCRTLSEGGWWGTAGGNCLTLQGLLAPLGLPCKLCPVDALLCEECCGGLWVALTSLPDVSPALQEGHA